MKKIGTKTYPNGTKYKGEIDKEGHPHGKGTMIFQNNLHISTKVKNIFLMY